MKAVAIPKTEPRDKVVSQSKGNPLEEYRELSDHIAFLEKKKEQLKGSIYLMLDQLKTDHMELGRYHAERTIFEQVRIDAELAKEFLGPKISKIQKTITATRLKVSLSMMSAEGGAK